MIGMSSSDSESDDPERTDILGALSRGADEIAFFLMIDMSSSDSEPESPERSDILSKFSEPKSESESSSLSEPDSDPDWERLIFPAF